ncbi:two-component response regulator-like PRR95 isoform X1 [Musa acuminata AAA Group]|uniref:two-component response regulator-like PRR95 isoform X1 n=1 Tax=Musa acuminata AAA Group TaxID=214697 RepID=UPI0031D005AD
MGEKEEGQGRRDEAEAMAVREWVEEEEAEEEREGAKGVALRWERFLPRVPVRVLLVEGDDSTRQIIAALLRKCSYRVAAASDGLKAWDVLMEKPQSVDLVLTEVDLPSISGFGLLTMIMDHESCRNIPVIMMSSHDSISMVFKCMLKGAADFLIKPIRKNELRNLWQHVWRRQIVDGHGGTHNIQDKHEAMHKMKAHYGEKEHSIENIAIVQANKEFGEQGSDAQSSCTRSDVEAESTHKQLKLKQTKVVDSFMTQNGGNIQMDNGSFNYENSITAASENVDEVQECLGYKKTNNKNYDQKCHHEIISKDDDLVRVVDNQPQGRLPSRDIVHVTNVKHKLSAAPYLELSLKRYEGTFPEKQECGGSNIWNHSSSSAFSLYTGRMVIPTMLEQKNSSSETNGLKPIEPLKDWDSRGNSEETKSSDVGPSVQDGMAVQCTPLRVIPFPLPVGSMPSSSGYGTGMQQMFYPQSGHPFWSTNPSIWREATMQTNSSIQPCQKNCNSVQCDLPDEENVRSSCYPSAGKQEELMQLDEQRQVSSAEGESGSSSICNGSRNFKSSECGSVLSGTTGHTSATHVFRPITVTGNDESKLTCDGSIPEDCHLLTQREIALNKFRLKRKERCFEKKVRYHSRKLLAEQRPRVKGQFVRQERPEPQPGQAGAFQSESAAA